MRLRRPDSLTATSPHAPPTAMSKATATPLSTAHVRARHNAVTFTVSAPVSAPCRRVFMLSRPCSPLFHHRLHHLTSPLSSHVGRRGAARARAPSMPHRLRCRRRRLPHPCLRRLGIAGEGLFPCAASPPRRLRAGVMPACQRMSLARSRAAAAPQASSEGKHRACASQRAGRGVGCLLACATCSWAMCAMQMGHVGTVHVGHALLCSWAVRGFGPVTVDLFFYFSNIFKSLQIQNFV
jgi:hypothetical protein